MTRVHQAATLIIIAFSIWVVAEAVQLNYYTELGPGPGFFPFWLALFLGTLAGIWFIHLWLRPLRGRAMEFMPNRAGFLRIAALIFSVAFFGLLVEKIGFTILMFAFLLFLLVALGRQSVFVTMAISLLGSFGVYYVFSQYLKVHLPPSSIEWLRNLGF
jgi:putative tricarboxylic transport membrane protein